MKAKKKMTQLGNIIQIDEQLVQSKLSAIVKDTVEETLNFMLDAEADRLCNAERYERTDARVVLTIFRTFYHKKPSKYFS